MWIFVVQNISIIVASEEVVEYNCYGPSSYSFIVKFALLRSMSYMSLISVRHLVDRGNPKSTKVGYCTQ
jgi:hypothetical protein